jgi:cytochrome c-type biogenesis protein CcmH
VSSTSRVLLVVAGAALVALLGVAAATVARPQPLSTAEQVDRIAAELRCPTCQALSVADSTSTAAREIRQQIAVLLEGGASADDVKRHFVDRYGEWILLAPSSPLPWLVPFALLAGGGAALALWLRRSGARAPHGEREAPERYGDRIREEVEALDA